MRFWGLDNTKYALARMSFHFDADVYFNNRHKVRCPVSLEDINKKLVKVSGLAVKLGIITPEKENEFRQKMYERAEKSYSPKK